MISPAFAQAAGQASVQSGLMSFLPFVLILGVFYFLILRPQMKRQKDHKNMIQALQKGDEVLTSGGVLGKISQCGDVYLTLEVAHKGDSPVEILVQRHAITGLLPPNTIKDLR